jgi:HD-like signal output (HDOD) protein
MTDKRFILDKLHQIPAVPMVVHEVMGSFRNEDTGSAELAHKISFDHGLSSRVLRVANSPFYGLQREVGTIQEAVMVLGFDSVRSLVVSAGFVRAFSESKNELFDRHEFWVRSFRIATYTEALTQRIAGDRQLAFTAGMFHDIGLLVLDVCVPELFIDILHRQQTSGEPLLALERSVLGFDHAEIGGDIAKRWNFPPRIEHAIRYWRKPEREPSDPTTDMVHIAVLLDQGLRGDDLMQRMPERLRKMVEDRWGEVEAVLPQAEQLDVVARLMAD